ncbi:MAG: hydroxymethylglutaryl-CoA synthase, partial [Rickettsiaceae bacterium]|nr:hydroxymethylglutaryl-CoA synthase [Rickettsiaceae bacterium]
MDIGINNIAMYTPNYYLSMQDFAKVKNLDYNKFLAMGQHQMSICPPDEDVVTMASNAASRAIKDIDTKSIGLVLFATESSVDQAKSAGLFLHKLLKLPSSCRVIELKQSCYAATGGLQLDLSYIKAHPQQKVLLIAADVARYDL